MKKQQKTWIPLTKSMFFERLAGHPEFGRRPAGLSRKPNI
jgi:hypothetical protein